MKKNIVIFLFSLLLMSCGDGNKKDKICLENNIFVENRCSSNIIVRYYEYEEEWDFFEDIIGGIFSVDDCDLKEQTLNIEPGSIVRFDVFLGACKKDPDNVLDDCSGFISDEILTIQLLDNFKEFSVDHIAGLVVSEKDFE